MQSLHLKSGYLCKFGIPSQASDARRKSCWPGCPDRRPQSFYCKSRVKAFTVSALEGVLFCMLHLGVHRNQRLLCIFRSTCSELKSVGEEYRTNPVPEFMPECYGQAQKQLLVATTSLGYIVTCNA